MTLSYNATPELRLAPACTDDQCHTVGKSRTETQPCPAVPDHRREDRNTSYLLQYLLSAVLKTPSHVAWPALRLCGSAHVLMQSSSPCPAADVQLAGNTQVAPMALGTPLPYTRFRPAEVLAAITSTLPVPTNHVQYSCNAPCNPRIVGMDRHP